MSKRKILLVEDNDIDAETVMRGLSAQKITNEVLRATDGQQALELLEGELGEDPLPIILLDLKMPRMDGLEFLQHLRRHETWRKALVFVMTASHDTEDRDRAYQLNVAGYILKDNAGADFIRVLELFQHYWEVVELPTGLALEIKG